MTLSLLCIVVGVFLIGVAAWDTFETIVLPRTVARDLRLTRLFYVGAWNLWSASIRRANASLRSSLLYAFGPLSLLMLIGIWAAIQVTGFAFLQFGLHSPLSSGYEYQDFGDYLYLSGVTFFTLGYGDITPQNAAGRTVSVVETGLGFAFLAVVISYLPVIYQSFSRREVAILLLDARAGSPSSAGELIRRHSEAGAMETLRSLLERYETWAANLLESYISYPILAYYRSQHEHQSWLSALTTIMDTCALVQVGFAREEPWARSLLWQARLTFALGRHVLVDLAYIVNAAPETDSPDRLTAAEWQRLCDMLDGAGVPLCRGESEWAYLQELRRQYEPFVSGLARHLCLSVPPWSAADGAPDDWQTSAWDSVTPPRHF